MLDTKSIDGEKKAHADNLLDSTRQKTLLKAGALQDAIFNSAYFSCIATDEKGVIQIFNVGAENMLGFAAADVINCITPADFSAQQELIERAAASCHSCPMSCARRSMPSSVFPRRSGMDWSAR